MKVDASPVDKVLALEEGKPKSDRKEEIADNIRIGRNSLFALSATAVSVYTFATIFRSAYRCHECFIFYMMLSVQESECFCIKAKTSVTCDLANTVHLCYNVLLAELPQRRQFKKLHTFSFLLKLIIQIHMFLMTQI